LKIQISEKPEIEEDKRENGEKCDADDSE